MNNISTGVDVLMLFGGLFVLSYCLADFLLGIAERKEELSEKRRTKKS